MADARAARRDIEDVTGPGFKIVSWNLLHRDGATADDINAMIARERPDLLLLQEATAATSTFLADAGGFYVTNAVPGSVHHLGAWSRLPLRQSPASLALQPGIVVRRRCQVIAFDEFSIANVHLSHGQMLNRRQLRRIAANLPRCAAIMGDCNLIGPAMLPGFRDVGPRQPTHKAGAFVPLRLDRCFVRAMKCDEAIALERGTSDHRPIAVRLSAVAPE